jgi:hypothetical protein
MAMPANVHWAAETRPTQLMSNALLRARRDPDLRAIRVKSIDQQALPGPGSHPPLVGFNFM